MGPPRKIGKICTIFRFFRPTQKIVREGPKWGGDTFFRHKKTSPTFWAERILILRTFDFWISWGPKFASIFFMGETYFQEFASIFFMGEKYFQEFAPNFFMGGPHVGPTHLGPTWAHALSGWAPRGPTHLGPGLGPGAAAGGAGAGAAGRILRSQPDPSPNAPRDQIRRKDPCCDFQGRRNEIWLLADFESFLRAGKDHGA